MSVKLKLHQFKEVMASRGGHRSNHGSGSAHHDYRSSSLIDWDCTKCNWIINQKRLCLVHFTVEQFHLIPLICCNLFSIRSIHHVPHIIQSIQIDSKFCQFALIYFESFELCLVIYTAPLCRSRGSRSFDKAQAKMQPQEMSSGYECRRWNLNKNKREKQQQQKKLVKPKQITVASDNCLANDFSELGHMAAQAIKRTIPKIQSSQLIYSCAHWNSPIRRCERAEWVYVNEQCSISLWLHSVRGLTPPC